MNSVVLKPQLVRTYTENAASTEPQYVTTVQPSQAFVYIDVQNVPAAVPKTNCQIISSQPFGTSFRRIRFSGMNISWDTPNVNPRNNELILRSSVTGLEYTISLGTGYYTSAATLAAHIVTQLNTVTGSSGLTFSVAAIPNMPNQFTLSAAGGLYYFINTSTAITKGYTVFGFPTQQAYTASKTLGTMGLIYSKYIDIVSSAVTKNAKIKTSASNAISNICARIPLDDPPEPGQSYKYAAGSYISFAHNVSEPLYNIDIKLLDQFGDIMYVNDPLTLFWDMAFEMEL
jgi:hypothetical protein